MQKNRYKRGYPIATLLGLEEDHAIIWNIFSHVAKKIQKIKLETRRDEKTLYNFHETIIKQLKSTIKEGTRTVVIGTPPRTMYSTDFMNHIKKHHKYLIQSKNPNRANFAELTGSVEDYIKVREIVQTQGFKQLISETTNKEADQIIENLEKNLNAKNDSTILYSLKEIENKIYNLEKSRETKKEYLILTDNYLENNRQKNRIHRLMQISKNKKIKTTVIDAESTAGTRITQFGGILYFSE